MKWGRAPKFGVAQLGCVIRFFGPCGGGRKAEACGCWGAVNLIESGVYVGRIGIWRQNVPQFVPSVFDHILGLDRAVTLLVWRCKKCLDWAECWP